MAKNNLADRLTANKIKQQNADAESHSSPSPSTPPPHVQKKEIKNTRLKRKINPNKPNKTEPTPITIAPLEEDDFSEDILQKEEEKEITFEQKDDKKRKKISRVVGVLLGIACAYVVFLIYGACVTSYEYTESGTTIAKEMSVKDIQERNDFNAILAQYESCRTLYEQVLSLDYRLALGVEDQKLIAPEYEGLLDSVEKVSVQISALAQETPTKYTQTVSLMQNWIQNDIALYLQNMSSAITLDDSEKATNALTDKENMYNDFAQITSNLASLGSVVSGVNLQTLNTWTPDSYTESLLGG